MQIANVKLDKSAYSVEKSVAGRVLINMKGCSVSSQYTVSFDHQASSIEIGVTTTLASPTAKIAWFGLYADPP